MRRKSLHHLVALVLVGYATVSTSASFAIDGVKAHPTKELFPFFTWSLFSWVPERRYLYVVEIQRLDNETFDPPLEMQDIPQFADKATLSYKTIQALGRSGGADVGARATFEGRYLLGRSVDYRILRLGFAPLERWHTGDAASAVVIAEHSTEPAQ